MRPRSDEGDEEVEEDGREDEERPVATAATSNDPPRSSSHAAKKRRLFRRFRAFSVASSIPVDVAAKALIPPLPSASGGGDETRTRTAKSTGWKLEQRQRKHFRCFRFPLC